jgi:hypothetical protein
MCLALIILPNGTVSDALAPPLLVEAMRRLLAQPEQWHGVVSAGELGDARGFLKALAPEHLTLEIE